MSAHGIKIAVSRGLVFAEKNQCLSSLKRVESCLKFLECFTLLFLESYQDHFSRKKSCTIELNIYGFSRVI